MKEKILAMALVLFLGLNLTGCAFESDAYIAS